MKFNAVAIVFAVALLWVQSYQTLAQSGETGHTGKTLNADRSRQAVELLERRVLQGEFGETLSAGWRRSEIIDFINESFELTRSQDLAYLMLNYADNVDYYDKGVVGKKVVFDDKQYFFNRWEEISYEIAGDVSIIDLPSHDAKELIFKVRFDVASPTRNSRSSGTSLTILEVRKINGEIKITGEKSEVIDE